jgi:hypothetical protein
VCRQREAVVAALDESLRLQLPERPVDRRPGDVQFLREISLVARSVVEGGEDGAPSRQRVHQFVSLTRVHTTRIRRGLLTRCGTVGERRIDD